MTPVKDTPDTGAQDLSRIQARFVKEYRLDRNGTQATIRSGYSEKSAASQASRLLKMDKIRRAIEEADAERDREIEQGREQYLRELQADREKLVEKGEHDKAAAVTMHKARITGDIAPVKTEAKVSGEVGFNPRTFMEGIALVVDDLNESARIEHEKALAIEASEVSEGRPADDDAA